MKRNSRHDTIIDDNIYMRRVCASCVTKVYTTKITKKKTFRNRSYLSRKPLYSDSYRTYMYMFVVLRRHAIHEYWAYDTKHVNDLYRRRIAKK